jgi:uncharacterized membrane protein
MAQRFIVAAASFFVVGLVMLILFGLVVSMFGLNFQTVMPGAIVAGLMAGVVGFCYPQFAMKVIDFLNF